MTETTPAPVKDRAASLQATRKAKMDEAFKGKKFKILREVHLEKGKVFQTPFGNKGRHGFVLEEVGNAANKFVIGATMLKQVARDYDAVELPKKGTVDPTADEVPTTAPETQVTASAVEV